MVISVQPQFLIEELNRTEIYFGSIQKNELTEFFEISNQSEPKLYGSVWFFGFAHP